MTGDPSAGPGARYAAGVAARQWQDDPAQQAALAALDRLHALLLREPPRASLRTWLGIGARPPAPRGLYLWGRVGRGKTFLMDLLAAALPPAIVLRRHFHRFMAGVHDALAEHDGERDPLERVAADIAAHTRVLCLDEFFVQDIGDAMILAHLLQALFRRGVLLVTTSNTAPAELYRDGLQHARFAPAIALLEQHCEVLEMVSDHDWRLRALKQAPTWHTPAGPDAERALAAVFERLAQAPGEAGVLTINGRGIPCTRAAGAVAWFAFDALCDGPRAVGDYIEIARSHDAVLLSGVPPFGPDNEDPARRFVNLVDAFYDCRVKLVCSAATAIVDLYDGERLRVEFARAESRLIEMQSEDYLAGEHRG